MILPWGLNSSNNRENTYIKIWGCYGFGWIWMDIDRFGWVWMNSLMCCEAFLQKGSQQPVGVSAWVQHQKIGFLPRNALYQRCGFNGTGTSFLMYIYKLAHRCISLMNVKIVPNHQPQYNLEHVFFYTIIPLRNFRPRGLYLVHGMATLYTISACENKDCSIMLYLYLRYG